MLKIKKTSLIALIILLGCGSNEKPVAPDLNYKVIEVVKGITTIEFSDTILNLGNVSATSVTTVYVKIMNTGKAPIIIKDVKSTCGCTVPKFPTKPIINEDSIQVSFASKGKFGIQNKIIRIYTNTIPEMNEIRIKANVVN